ncbi:hypothetical protein [Streptomyces sp. SID13726]|uniref:hypothetical protein n=1 Tax=Streptomyces sp. SID13726 TaxID=2706058 RepID=UPI0013B60517|nr:hypothetical protein [Streptomyces sp. SID13726]NEB06080.1 hypothetical protein [Streptomyces sp. SID13726]
MATPPWWEELVGVSEVLAEADRAEVESWRGPEAQGAPDDVPPLTVRLGALGRAYTGTSAQAPTPAAFSEAQTRQLFRLLEDIQVDGSDQDRDAVATGFFEVLLNAWDKGFDLRSVWPAVGPESRAYCLAWNDFTGVPTPDWMR